MQRLACGPQGYSRKTFIGTGTASRSKPLTFYLPFSTTLSYTFHMKWWYPFHITTYSRKIAPLFCASVQDTLKSPSKYLNENFYNIFQPVKSLTLLYITPAGKRYNFHERNYPPPLHPTQHGKGLGDPSITLENDLLYILNEQRSTCESIFSLLHDARHDAELYQSPTELIVTSTLIRARGYARALVSKF